MNHYAQYEIKLTHHAHCRYLERVAQMERGDLQRWCAEHIQAQNYRVKNKLIQIHDVWFCMRKHERSKQLYLTTCYGRSHLDIPEAIIWAERHNDRINLNETVDGLNGGLGL